MSREREAMPMLLPTHWTPKQALAAFELIEILREQLWVQYGREIQRAVRADRVQAIPPTSVTTTDDPPF